jgi:hypothetical protein
MKTMTIDEFEQEVQQLLISLKNGKRQRVQLDIQIVKEQQIPTAEELVSLTQQQREIIERGWSIEMAKILTNPNPNWHLEPDFLPAKEYDDYRDPFTNAKDK